MTLVPANSTSEHISPIAEADASLSTPGENLLSSTERLFAALTDCANLHPDPISDSDPDSGAGGPAIAYEGDGHFTINGDHSSRPALPPPMPGSGGWITAENVGDFYDEDGNPRDQEDDMSGYLTRIAGADGPLGNGAGSVRARGGDEDGDDTDEDVRLNGDETKWRRTE